MTAESDALIEAIRTVVREEVRTEISSVREEIAAVRKDMLSMEARIDAKTSTAEARLTGEITAARMDLKGDIVTAQAANAHLISLLRDDLIHHDHGSTA